MKPMLRVVLYTNRNIGVYDKASGEQVAEYQGAVDCYGIHDPDKLMELLSIPSEYYISRWMRWSHEITKREFEYLLGLRTRQGDIDEQVAIL